MDAYHFLSIDGYQVNNSLIEKVQYGKWNPDDENNDHHKNALAACRYWEAFQAVKLSIKKVKY